MDRKSIIDKRTGDGDPISRSFFVLAVIALAMLAAVTVLVSDEMSENASGASSGTSGGTSWVYDNKTLTISPLDDPPEGYSRGQMMEYKSEEGKSTAPWTDLIEEGASLVINTGVTHIGQFSFTKMSFTGELVIPGTVTYIGKQAFYKCDKITSVKFECDQPTFGKSGAVQDKVFDLNSGSKTAKNYDVLSKNQWANSETFPEFDYTKWNYEGKPVSTVDGGINWSRNDSSKTIEVTASNAPQGGYASGQMKDYDAVGPWGAATSGYTLTIGSGVTNIGSKAFNGCGLSGTITIPSTVTSVNADAFYGCSPSAFAVDSGNNYFSSSDGVLYSKDLKTLVRYPSGSTATFYTVPGTVTTISSYAFGSTSSTLTAIYVHALAAPTIDDTVFIGLSLTVHTPYGTDYGTWTGKTGVNTLSTDMISVPAAVGGLSYDSTVQTGVAANTQQYTISGNTGKDANEYEAEVKPKDGLIWMDDHGNGAKKVKWSIAKATITVGNGTTPITKVYDGKTDGISLVLGTHYTFAGVFGTDNVDFVSSICTFDSSGVDAAKVTIASLQLNNSNYTIASAELIATITQKGIEGAVITLGEGLTYNGQEQTQTVTSVTIDGLDVTYDPIAGCTGKDAGEYTLTVTGNGNFTGTATKVFTIGQKAVTVSGITALNKAHDGNTEATLAFDKVVINGLIQGDSLTVTATGAFDNPDAGTGKTVRITNIAISGASAGNYKVAATGNQETAVADITGTGSASQPLDNVLIAAMAIAALAVLVYIGYAARKV